MQKIPNKDVNTGVNKGTEVQAGIFVMPPFGAIRKVQTPSTIPKPAKPWCLSETAFKFSQCTCPQKVSKMLHMEEMPQPKKW